MLKQQKIYNTLPTTTSQSVEREPQPTRTRMFLIMLAICAGYFMVILDTTIVNIALANMHQQLGASGSELQWIVDGYSLVFASLLLTAGALGDRLGSKNTFLAGLMLFTVASALCGFSSTLWGLQLARVVQGVGAALLVPGSLALLSYTFADAKERARAIGIWGAIGGIGAVMGPVVGGFLVNTFSWRSIFLLNVPVGIVAFLLTWRFVAAAPRLPQRGLDLAAQIVGIIALGMLTLALIEGNPWGWSSLPILGSLLICVLMTIAFLLIERRVQQSMLPLELFAMPTFSAATIVGFLINFGFYGQLFCISLFFQQIRGYSPFVAGLALLPETIMVLFAAWFSGRVTGRTGSRLPMVIGLAVGGVGFLLLSLVNASTSYLLMSLMLVAIGFGMAFTMPAMTTAMIASAPGERSGIAAAVLNSSRQVGGVLGVAILGSLVSKESAFVPGMHIALLLSGSAFLAGCVLSWFAIERRPQAA